MTLHVYQALQQNICYDTVTDCILSVDKIVYDMMKADPTLRKETIMAALSTEYDRASLENAWEEIQVLISEGLLNPTADVIGPPAQRPAPVIKAMCLHVAHDCDLRCKYCFASQGDFKGDRQLMTEETGRKALEFLVAHSGNRKNLEVDFFGGEPLLNFDVVKALTLYGEELNARHNKNIRFTITTNGVLLDDEKIDFINEHMSNVVMSLDGRKEVHDAMRPTINGKGSYEIVVEKFKKLLEKRGKKDSYIRGTFTGNNLDFHEDVMHYFDLGFQTVSMEPVVTDPKMSYAIREEQLPEVLASYEKLASLYHTRQSLQPELKFFHFMIDLTEGPCLAKRRMGCGAGVEYISVTPFGDIYPCHQFVGETEYRIGSLAEGIIRQDIVDKFTGCSVDTKEACRECWNHSFCSGGCHANAYFNNGTIQEPFALGCEMQKKRTELAIALQALASNES